MRRLGETAYTTPFRVRVARDSVCPLGPDNETRSPSLNPEVAHGLRSDNEQFAGQMNMLQQDPLNAVQRAV